MTVDAAPNIRYDSDGEWDGDLEEGVDFENVERDGDFLEAFAAVDRGPQPIGDHPPAPHEEITDERPTGREWDSGISCGAGWCVVAGHLEPANANPTFFAGSRVLGNFGGMGFWYMGTVSRAAWCGFSESWTHDIVYADGDRERSVDSDFLCAIFAQRAGVEERALSLARGARVLGDVRGNGVFCAGEVRKVWRDGSCDVLYGRSEGAEWTFSCSMFRFVFPAIWEKYFHFILGTRQDFIKN